MRIENILSLQELREAGIDPKAWLKPQNPDNVKVTTTPAQQNTKVNPTGNYNINVAQPNNPNGINPVNWLKPQNPNAVKINQTTPAQANQTTPAQANQTTPAQANQTTPAGLTMPKAGILSKATGALANVAGKVVGGVQGAAQGAGLAYNRAKSASSAAAARNVAGAAGMSVGQIRNAQQGATGATTGGTTTTGGGSTGATTGKTGGTTTTGGGSTGATTGKTGGTTTTGGGAPKTPPAVGGTKNTPFPNLVGSDFDSTHNVPITPQGANEWNSEKEKANNNVNWFKEKEENATKAGYSANKLGVWQAPQQSIPTAESVEDVIRLAKLLSKR